MPPSSTSSGEKPPLKMLPSTPARPPAAAPAVPPRPYQPQFTAITESILKRMRTGNSNISSAIAGAQADAGDATQWSQAKIDDARRRLIQGLKVSDNIELPAVPTPRLKGQGHHPTHVSSGAGTSEPQAGQKRKRGQGSSRDSSGSPYYDAGLEGSGSDAMRPPPRPPQKRTRAKGTDGIKRCVRCTRQSWTEDNFFVECPACGEHSHLMCNPPNMVRAWKSPDPGAAFRCGACLDEEREEAEFQRAKVEHARVKRQREISMARGRVVASLPLGMCFNKTDKIGFYAGNASDEMRSRYFSSMPRRDLVELVTLCDKMHPGLLADLLVHATKKFPDLPIFDSPDWVAQIEAADTGASGPGTPGTDPGHRYRGAPLSIASPGSNGSKPALVNEPRESSASLSGPTQARTVDAADAWDEDDSFLPTAWPRGEGGAYSALPPESQDLVLLETEDDGVAFDGFEALPTETACC